MTLDFPNNPPSGATYSSADGTSEWFWDGAKWTGGKGSGTIFLPLSGGTIDPGPLHIKNSADNAPGVDITPIGMYDPLPNVSQQLLNANINMGQGRGGPYFNPTFVGRFTNSIYGSLDQSAVGLIGQVNFAGLGGVGQHSAIQAYANRYNVIAQPTTHVTTTLSTPGIWVNVADVSLFQMDSQPIQINGHGYLQIAHSGTTGAGSIAVDRNVPIADGTAGNIVTANNNPQLWGLNINVNDDANNTGVTSSKQTNYMIGCELDFGCNGMDDGGPLMYGVPAGLRAMLTLIGMSSGGSGPAEISDGIVAGPGAGSNISWKRIYSAGQATFSQAAFDTRSATQRSGANAVWLAAGHSIAFEPTNACKLHYDTTLGGLILDGTGLEISGYGVNYTGISGGAWVGFQWTGSQLVGYINGTSIGAFAVGGSGFVPLTGGTMSGPLIMQVGQGGWSSGNYGKQLLISAVTNYNNPALGFVDASGTHYSAITAGYAGGSGFGFMQMPPTSDSTTPPVLLASITTTGINSTVIGQDVPENGKFLALTATSGVVNGPWSINDPSGSTSSSLTVEAINSNVGAGIRLFGNGATTPSKYLRAANGQFQIMNDAYNTVLMAVDDAGDLTTHGTIGGTSITASANLTVNGNTTAAAGTFSSLSVVPNGLGFANQTGASVTDLSKHLRLYGTTDGINITPGQWNFVASSTQAMVLNTNGINAVIGATTPEAGTFTAVNATGLQIGVSTIGNLQFSAGDATHPGYIQFYQGTTRVGYIGYTEGANHLLLETENGYTGYSMSGNLTVNGITSNFPVSITDNGSGGSYATLALNAPNSGIGPNIQLTSPTGASTPRKFIGVAGNGTLHVYADSTQTIMTLDDTGEMTLSNGLIINNNQSWSPIQISNTTGNPCMMTFQGGNTGQHQWWVGAWGGGGFWIRDNNAGNNAMVIPEGATSVQFPGNLTVGAGASLNAGTGAPTATAPVGSIYMRTDGAVGTTLYVSRGSGTWNAVAGV